MVLQHGLQTVPESWLRQEDKENSVCREIRENRLERALHEITHLSYQPWCARCVMEKGRAKPHLQRPVESVNVPEFEMDFCYLLQDPLTKT